jgi:hypothetical protein
VDNQRAAQKVIGSERLDLKLKANLLQDGKKIACRYPKSEMPLAQSYSPDELNQMREKSYYYVDEQIRNMLNSLIKDSDAVNVKSVVQKCRVLQGIQRKKYAIAIGEEVSEKVEELNETWGKSELRQQYRTLCNKLKNCLVDMKGTTIAASKVQELVVMVNVLEAKYRKQLQPQRNRKIVCRPYPTTAEEVNELFNGSEETIRPWKVLPTSQVPENGMLFRTWDAKSQCRILDADFGLLSGGVHSNFDTKEGRIKDLAAHGNWRTRSKTPFISTTPSMKDIVSTWIRAFRKRQNQPFSTSRITLINSKARLDAGWPIIKMVDELDHYKFDIPKKCSRETFLNEYLLPFRARREEIVWTWHWKDVRRWMSEHNTKNSEIWEVRVAEPMFKEHERLRKAGKELDEIQAGLAGLLQSLMPYAVRTYMVGAGALIG